MSTKFVKSVDEANALLNKLISDGVLTAEAVAQGVASLHSVDSPPAKKQKTNPPQQQQKMNPPPPQQQKKNNKKAFDPSTSLYRQVYLKLAYDGSSYGGFTENIINEGNSNSNSKNDVNDTVEFHMFQALQKAKLIVDRFTCNYTRCGRTDRGVSAFGQVSERFER